MATKETTTARTATRTPSFRKPNHRTASTTGAESFFFFSAKVSVYLLTSCVCLIILFQVRNLQTAFSPLGTPGLSSSWSLPGQWQKLMNMTTTAACLTDSVDEEARKDQPEQNLELQGMLEKLRQSVTFLPLKDLRYADKHMEGNTWFMSTMNDTHEKGEVGHQFLPSNSSLDRVLCVKGNHTRDGSWNSYALAWPDALPSNSTYLPGLTFVSYNPYIYDNIWHGLSAIHPFVAWHQMNQCHPGPDRWVLYYLGELRFNMASWLRNITDATFDRPTNIETFDGVAVASQPVCFEKAVVIRHGQSGMSRERMMEAYDLMRCKARKYCKLELNRVLKGDVPDIGLTMFMRTGARSFKNESAVIAIFQRECDKVDGCRLTVAHSDNLSFCEQVKVKVMSMTDILVSSHGAQLTNMFLMDRNSSVMEFFPKGWLETAGVGQYVYHWMASWSGMSHAGAWRDPDGESCPYPKSDLRCMSFYKDGRIGHNETYFAEWARKVLSEVKTRKMEELKRNSATPSASSDCACRSS